MGFVWAEEEGGRARGRAGMGEGGGLIGHAEGIALRSRRGKRLRLIGHVEELIGHASVRLP